MNEKRRLRQMLNRAAMKWRNRVVAAAFDAWLAFTSTQRRRRALAIRVVGRWQYREVARALSGLYWTLKERIERRNR